jgi:hypothetical protein
MAAIIVKGFSNGIIDFREPPQEVAVNVAGWLRILVCGRSQRTARMVVGKCDDMGNPGQTRDTPFRFKTVP